MENRQFEIENACAQSLFIGRSLFVIKEPYTQLNSIKRTLNSMSKDAKEVIETKDIRCAFCGEKGKLETVEDKLFMVVCDCEKAKKQEALYNELEDKKKEIAEFSAEAIEKAVGEYKPILIESLKESSKHLGEFVDKLAEGE